MFYGNEKSAGITSSGIQPRTGGATTPREMPLKCQARKPYTTGGTSPVQGDTAAALFDHDTQPLPDLTCKYRGGSLAGATLNSCRQTKFIVRTTRPLHKPEHQ